MDRSRIFTYLLIFCFSIAPFWSASEAENDLADSLETAFDQLDPSIQSQLYLKQLVVEAIDVSNEVNEALGYGESGMFDNPSKYIVLPVELWAVIRSIYASKTILASDVRKFTPEFKARTLRLVKKHFNTRFRLNAETKNLELKIGTAEKFGGLTQLKERLATLESELASLESQVKAGAETSQGKSAGKTAQAFEEGKSAGKTAQAFEEGKSAGKTAQASEEGKSAGKTAQASEEGKSAGKTAQASEEGKSAGKTAQASEESKGAKNPIRSGEIGAVKNEKLSSKGINNINKQINAKKRNISVTKQAISKMEEAVKVHKEKIASLTKELDKVSSRIAHNLSFKHRNVFSRVARGVGHTIRWVALPALSLGSIFAYLAVVSDAVIIAFEDVLDVEAVREQYMQDIEAIMNEAMDASY